MPLPARRTDWWMGRQRMAPLPRTRPGGSDATLAVGEIHAIGSSGDFLSTDHTLRHMRDFSVSNLLDRRVRMAWETDGGLDMRARATAKAKEILGDHKPEPLPEDVAKELTAIVARCEKAGRGASPH